MTKKYIFTYFFLFSLIMLFWIGINMRSISTDVYDLLEIDIAQSSKQALDIVQARISKEVAFLSMDASLFENLETLNQRYNVFDSIQTFIDIESNGGLDSGDFMMQLNMLKLASLNKQTYAKLTQSPNVFLQENVKNLLNSFNVSFVSLHEDLLNLAQYSTLLNTQGSLKLDIQNSLFYALYDGEKYYFAKAILKDNFSSDALLLLLKDMRNLAEAKNTQFLSYGGAIFGAYAKNEGNKESIYMGIVSLILVCGFVFLAFGSVRVLWLILVIGFSFLCGLSGAFLLLENIHLLSLVISTSLVGLILDFSLHWLTHSKRLTLASMRDMRALFTIGLCITCSGYAMFLFAPMEFLHQIALISIFALFGAFAFTYFMLPFLLENIHFQSKYIFRKFLFHLVFLLKKIYLYRYLAFSFIACIIVAGAFFFTQITYSDNIKDYSSLPPNLLKESAEFSKISGFNLNTKILILQENRQERQDLSLLLEREKLLVNELLNKQLINGYEGISKYFLSQDEQEKAKASLVGILESENTKALYENLGFSKQDLSRMMQIYNSLPIISIDTILQIPIGAEFSRFILSDGASLVMLESPQESKEFYEILESYKAEFLDFNQKINQSFNEIKTQAILLKICAYVLAWVILFFFFGVRIASVMIASVLCATLLTVVLLLFIGVKFNIFVVFGLILAGAVGIDYLLFARHIQITRIRRILGIFLASVTSIISFSLLATSATYAVFSFGISASLCMALCAVFAMVQVFQK